MHSGSKLVFTVSCMLGIFFGISVFTFFYARGASYFFDDPKSCKNCHIMRGQFDAWSRSTHKPDITCNDCHTPKNIVQKYAVKGINGWKHSAAFTLGNFHEPIRIHGFGRRVVLGNCVRCHGGMVGRMTAFAGDESPDCIRCHRNTGHATKL